MGTPVLDRFLQEVGSIIQRREGGRLQDTLQIEPPLPPAYETIEYELKNHFRRGNDQALVARCEQVIPTHEDGASSWGAFPDFLTRYFRFLRDADPGNLTDLYGKLKSLTNQAVIALSHTSNGVIILPTVLYLSKVLAKVALGLDRNPDLVANVPNDQKTGDAEGATEKVTFVESSANVLREAFIKCLADMSGGAGGAGRRTEPENKRTGIYMTANSCLKLLFQCRKLRNAQQMFVSIQQQSPLLSYYSASQRVTYLYYLGRYLFANSHFYRAQLCLESAYTQCHAQALRQRQIILMYLIVSNVCLGRFPSSKLLMRREAAELAPRFLPLCRTIARGDLSEFRRLLSTSSEEGQWFLRKRMLLQLRSTCEVLVWRSLVRKVFILNGYHPQGDDNKMPFLRLTHVEVAVRWLEQREAAPNPHGHPATARMGFGSLPVSNKINNTAYVDSEFEGMGDAIKETGFDIETGEYHEQTQENQGGVNGLVLGEVSSNGMNGATEEETRPSLGEIESIVASMLQQGLLGGFLTHTNPRFAISGSKAGGGALKTGFPNVWQTISARSSNTVPGWVTDSNAGSGLGGVVNVTGSRLAGA